MENKKQKNTTVAKKQSAFVKPYAKEKLMYDEKLDGDATWLPEELKGELSDFNLHYFLENRITSAHAKGYDFVELNEEGIAKYKKIMGSLIQEDGKIAINGAIFGEEVKQYLMMLPKDKFYARKDKQRTQFLNKNSVAAQLQGSKSVALDPKEDFGKFSTEVFGEETFSPL